MKRFLKLWLCLVFAAAMQATAQTNKPVMHSYAFDDGAASIPASGGEATLLLEKQ